MMSVAGKRRTLFDERAQAGSSAQAARKWVAARAKLPTWQYTSAYPGFSTPGALVQCWRRAGHHPVRIALAEIDTARAHSSWTRRRSVPMPSARIVRPPRPADRVASASCARAQQIHMIGQQPNSLLRPLQRLGRSTGPSQMVDERIVPKTETRVDCSPFRKYRSASSLSRCRAQPHAGDDAS